MSSASPNKVWQEAFAAPGQALLELSPFDSTQVLTREGQGAAATAVCAQGDALVSCGSCSQGFALGKDGRLACRPEPLCKQDQACSTCQIGRMSIDVSGPCEACVEPICDSLTGRCMCAGHS